MGDVVKVRRKQKIMLFKVLDCDINTGTIAYPAG
jgi:hypothetical protein